MLQQQKPVGQQRTKQAFYTASIALQARGNWGEKVGALEMCSFIVGIYHLLDALSHKVERCAARCGLREAQNQRPKKQLAPSVRQICCHDPRKKHTYKQRMVNAAASALRKRIGSDAFSHCRANRHLRFTDWAGSSHEPVMLVLHLCW